MDMSFIFKQMLPPGVSVEALQATAIDIAQRIVVAAQRIEAMHAMAVEQDAMLRSLVAACQAQSSPIHQETHHDHGQRTNTYPAITTSGLNSAPNAAPGGSLYAGDYSVDSDGGRIASINTGA